MKPLSLIAALLIVAALPFSQRGALAASRDIIICGSGGDKTYEKKFTDWGQRLRAALAEQRGAPADNITLLLEWKDQATTFSGTSDLETIHKALEDAAEEASPEDDLFLYLIGHGSHWRGVSRLHVPGPDLTAEDLARALGRIRARRIVVIDASSSSAGFINVLSGPGRVIIAATKSVEEKNATEFMEYFIQALEDGSADRNRDERVSALEACRQATDLTEAHYLGQGLIATEHALIDDNGDSRGTRLAGETNQAASPDGALADHCFLKDFSFPDAVPRALVQEYLASLNRVEELKSKKQSMEADAYYVALEALLVDAAKLNRRIRRAAAP